MTQKTYYYVDAEVPGWVSNFSSQDDGETAVEPLHLIFEGWMGDDIVTTSPYWFVTERLANTLGSSNLTGFRLEQVLVSPGDQYALAAKHSLPLDWMRLVPTGTLENNDDIALVDTTELAVSGEVLAIFRSYTLQEAGVFPVDEDATAPPQQQ